jgi:hypothetical protein
LNQKIKIITIIIIIIILLTITGESHAMSKMYLFSEVKGVVVQKGVPVEGAVVEQEFRWAWKDEVGLVQTKTATDGKFSFPAVVRSSFLGSLLPHEPMIRQTILIRYAGNEYKAWMFDKGSYKENSELQGKAISLYCDLEEPLSHKGEVYGICQLR